MHATLTTLKPPRPLIADDFAPAGCLVGPTLLAILDPSMAYGKGLDAPRATSRPGESVG